MSKKNSRDLYDLIKSLNPSEKRQFTLYIARQAPAKENKYAHLFTFLDKMRVYDDGELAAAARSKGISDLPGLKQYLYEMILRCLRDLRSGRTQKSKLKGLMAQIEILFFKELFDQCRKSLMKAKKIAETLDEFATLIEIQMWETKLLHRTGETEDIRDHLARLRNETLDYAEKLHNSLELEFLGSEITVLEMLIGLARDEGQLADIEKIMQSDVLRDESRALSVCAKVDYFDIKMRYYRIQDNFEKSFYYSERKLHHFRMHPEYADHYAYAYAFAHTHFLMECLNLRYYEKFNEVLASLRALKPRHPIIALAIDEGAYFAELWYLIHTIQEEELITLVNTAAAWLEKTNGRIEISSELSLYYSFAYANIVIGKHEEALGWLNTMLDHPRVSVMEQYECFGRILCLIVHFELGNAELIRYHARSTYRFLASKKRLFGFESLLLDFIKRLPSIGAPDELRSFFRELRKKVAELSNDPFEQRALTYFDFDVWLQSKIERRPFIDVYRSRIELNEKAA